MIAFEMSGLEWLAFGLDDFARLVLGMSDLASFVFELAGLGYSVVSMSASVLVYYEYSPFAADLVMAGTVASEKGDFDKAVFEGYP